MSSLLAGSRSSARLLSRCRCRCRCRYRCRPAPTLRRNLAVAVASESLQPGGKKEGDISSVFVSLSGAKPEALPDRFRVLKQSLVAGHEEAVAASWVRLLAALRRENELVAAKGPAVLPSVEFKSLRDDLRRLRDEIRLRGAAVIRGVVDEREARAYKTEAEAYVAQNPHTKAFPADNPQVFELYWSAPQLRARSQPNMLKTQAALMEELWTVGAGDEGLISLTPLSYADRLRIRQPGDAQFALGPHVDGGGVERWEREGYGGGGGGGGGGGDGGGVYDAVFRGEWEAYDPWTAGPRVRAVTDRYDGAGACSMFRMFQAWLAASHTRPREGTLLVNPLLQLSTAYILLRPFFAPVRPHRSGSSDDFLHPRNWAFSAETSELQGASPSHAQELNDALHPHLQLDRTMVHVPEIRPGDYVVWHCDQIHAVDRVHHGSSDSSVLYIPVCPTTEANLRYLRRQREAFRHGFPAPDFPGGRGEADHIGRPGEDVIASDDGKRAMGLLPLNLKDAGMLGPVANSILGF